MNSNTKGYKQWFSLARKKALNKKQCNSFGLENAFYAYCDEGLLEKYITPRKKKVSTSQKISIHQQEYVQYLKIGIHSWRRFSLVEKTFQIN